MWEYWQINLFLCALSLLAIRFLRTSPARPKFYLAICAILFWFVPWQSLNIPLPQSVTEPFRLLKVYELQDIADLFVDPVDIAAPYVEGGMINRERPTQNLSETPTHSPPTDQTPWTYGRLNHFAKIGFIALMLFSVLWALKVWRAHQRLVKKWFLQSSRATELEKKFGIEHGNITIRFLKNAGPGMTTGIVKPVIWVDPKISETEIVRAIVIHELHHIKQYDIIWLCIIQLAAHVFWWNPLVKLLCRKAEYYMELSCDEKSTKTLENGQYIKSLARLMLSMQNMPSSAGSLGISGVQNLNVRRLKALTHMRYFQTHHALLLMVFSLLVVSTILIFAYDEKLRDFFQPKNDAVFVAISQEAELEYALEDKPFFEFMQLLKQKRYDLAEIQFHKLKQQMLDADEPNRISAFRVLAVYLNDVQRHDDIPKLLNALLTPDHARTNGAVQLFMAIAYIQTGEYKKAIEILEFSELEKYRGYPTRLVLAQAYHLNKQYDASNKIIADTLQHKRFNFYNTHYTSLLMLQGRNAEILDNAQLIERSKALLGDNAPEDFSHVTADQQMLPHIYHLPKTLNGHKLSGFNAAAFPLNTNITAPKHPAARRAHREALRHANFGDLARAADSLSLAVSHLRRSTLDIPQSDMNALYENLFILAISSGKQNTIKSVAEMIVEQKGITKSILARAHWMLAYNTGRYTKAGLEHFTIYTGLQGEPNIATDHEMIERFYANGELTGVLPSLQRVMAFYETHGSTPDIRTLNRIIGILEKTGRSEEQEKYQQLFAEYFPRALDFTLDTQLNIL